MSWEQQLFSMIEGNHTDEESLMDFGVAYAAETGDESFFDMSFIELFSLRAKLLPPALSAGIHINRSAAHSGKLSWAGLLGSGSCAHIQRINCSSSVNSRNSQWSLSASNSSTRRLSRSVNWR